ncbi:MAG: YdcF family protein [Thermoleophilia bacterium]|nr:YdcF family protein [Thermoleophilia bacterium]MDH5332444.1 YdcF family protein [Thermoleophilia bacterium]
MRSLTTLAFLLLVAGYAIGGALFLARDDDPVSRADAVVVLAGGDTRLDVGLELVREGVAPVLVVSEDTSGRDGRRVAFCANGGKGAKLGKVEVVCRKAAPFSTRGEARLVAGLADKRDWSSLVVVSSRYHLFRAERLFARCTDAKLALRGAPEEWWRNVLAVPVEWVKLGLAETTRRGC